MRPTENRQFEADYSVGVLMSQTQYYALLSIVFMIDFVLLFDRVHFKAGKIRALKRVLM